MHSIAVATTLTAALLLAAALPSFAQTTNADTVRLFYEALTENQPDLLDDMLAPDWEDIPLSAGQEVGREGFKPAVGGLHQTFSDFVFVNDEVIEAGDTVIMRTTVSGTQIGPFAGVPSEGGSFSIMVIDIQQFEDGLIVRSWHVED